MIWVKALHVISMVTWFAGLFYLPRLFVYHADCQDEISHERFKIMERKLYIMMNIGALLTFIFGVWLLIDYAWDAYIDTIWLPAKLGLVSLLLIYHHICGRFCRSFRDNNNQHSHIYYRWFNEAPVLILIAVILLAVGKPF